MTRRPIRIGWLYPDLMNIYGDRGNIICLQRRCEWRGIPVEVRAIGLHEQLDADEWDILFIGGGQDREQRLVAEDLVTAKSAGLRAGADGGLVVLAICGGYQLLGHEYRDADGTVLQGLHILDMHTEPAPRGERRIIGNLVAACLLPGTEGAPHLVGFENHGGRTYLGPSAQPLARVIRGGGNNGKDGLEGCVAGNVFGTYMHGSFLPKNAWFADLLIERAARRHHGDFVLAPLPDELEHAARDAAEQRALSVQW